METFLWENHFLLLLRPHLSEKAGGKPPTTRIFAGLPEVLVMCGTVVDSGVVDHAKKEGSFLFLLIWDISRFHQSLSTWKEKEEQQYVANQKKEKQEAKLF